MNSIEIFQGCLKTKNEKKKKKHEEMEFHNSIQHQVFTFVFLIGIHSMQD